MVFFKPQPTRLPIQFKIPPIMTPLTTVDVKVLEAVLKWHKVSKEAVSDKRDRLRHGAICLRISEVLDG